MRPPRLLLAVAVAVPIVVFAATREVLLGTTPSRIPRTASTTAVVIQNTGPQPICCAQTADGGAPPDCVVVPPGSNLSLDIPANQPVQCSAPVPQVADAGTRVMEVY